MGNSIKTLLICAGLFSVTFLNSQVARQANQWSGVPCSDCSGNAGNNSGNKSDNAKGSPNTVQNGNGTIATSYTVTQCGLGFTTASVRLNQRAFTGMTVQKGVLQPAAMLVSGIPPCFQVVKAFLYVGGSGNGVAINATIVNPALASNTYPMTMIGTHTDKCWGYSGTYNYRADVTSCITGNGTYNLSGIPCLGTTPNDMDGATLIVIYADPSQTFTGHMVIGDGCREVSGGTITNNITGFNVCGAVTAGSTQNFVIVSDLQAIAATPINLNSATANYTYPAASNKVWDYIQQPGAPAVAGQTSATYGFSNASDCYNFVAAGMYYRTACQVCSSPALTITPVTTSSCSAGSATANVVGGTGPYTYTWSPTGGNAQSVSSVPTGNYTVTVKDATGCNQGTATIAINAASGPTITANAGTVCAGSSANLTANGALTYTWSPSASLNTATGPNVIATPAATQVYSISGTNGAGCVSTITTQVLVNPMPVPTIGSNSPVCLNSPINLTSGGGTSFVWTGPNSFSSTLQNPTVPAATTANAGVYNVTVTALGCSTATNITVSVITPTTSASNTGPYCAGSTVQLNCPTAASSYAWTGPSFSSGSQNPTIGSSTPAMSGNYTVLVTIGTCTATATTSVTVNALPTPAPSNTGPYCPGATIQLNVGAYSTYTWTGPSFTSNVQNPTIANAQVAHSGMYAVTVQDANGCINTSNTNVLVNPTPVITNNNPGTCVNQTINLTSTGGGTYLWTGPMSFSSTAQNPSIPNAVLGMSGPYNLLVTSAAGCTNSAVSNVTVYPLPNPNITSNSPVCVGNTLNLFGTGGATYAWSGPGYTGPTQNPTINNVTSSANGVYTLLVSSGTCTASTTFTVVINPLPVFNFSGTNVLCNGQSNGTSTVNVTVGTGPFNYNWSTIPSQNTQVATSLPAGTFSCTVTDANNCTSMASTQITQPTQFSVSVVSNTLSACANTPINVNAIGAGGTGPYTYNWVSGPATSALVANEPNAGNYMYTMNAVDAYNCPATANINLTFFPLPTVTATSGTICAGQTTSLTASGANTYIWQPGNITGPTYPFSGSTSQNITVIGTANGCSNSANTAVLVNPNPVSTINVGNAKGCVPTCVTFTAGSSSSIQSYNWILNGAGITGSVNGAYCFDESASYTLGLTVMDGNGCTSTVVPVTIDIYPQPVADFNHAPIKPIVNQDPFVTFTDASWNATIVSWNWYFMNTAQHTSIEQNPTFSYTEPGTYPVVLVVKSDKGCTDTLIRPLVVGEDFGLYVPNAFTPNGDGLNDIFQPKGFGVVKYEIFMFDRWGEKVFATKEFTEGWDGSFQGRGTKSCEEGTYTWLIQCTDVFGKSHELKGHVTLMK